MCLPTPQGTQCPRWESCREPEGRSLSTTPGRRRPGGPGRDAVPRRAARPAGEEALCPLTTSETGPPCPDACHHQWAEVALSTPCTGHRCRRGLDQGQQLQAAGLCPLHALTPLPLSQVLSRAETGSLRREPPTVTSSRRLGPPLPLHGRSGLGCAAETPRLPRPALRAFTPAPSFRPRLLSHFLHRTARSVSRGWPSSGC